ncbi:MAG: acyl carrier protein [Actinobacteria bacterium]|nr:acyl carrier protein [Actinomycetota bacterium]
MSVFDEVKSVVAEVLGIEAGDINMETNLTQDLQANSLDVVEIVTMLEEKYDLNIVDEDLMDMNTIKDVVNFLETKVNVSS